MNSQIRTFIVNSIKLPINASHEEAFSIARAKLLKLNINLKNAKFSIYRRSIDARNKKDIFFVYSVLAEGCISKVSEEKLASLGIVDLKKPVSIDFERGNEKLFHPPLVVGSGPCGLFAALILAESGYKPTVIERGGSISERTAIVSSFSKTRKLDLDTNIQFGAGGAGTFSDGKLVTRINDPLIGYIIKRFVDFGAPPEIEYIAKPHIGTDILSLIVDNMLKRISDLGGKVLYHTKLISVDSKASVAKTSVGDIPYGALVLAIGHSARDTYDSLFKTEFSIIPKAFSVGMRTWNRLT